MQNFQRKQAQNHSRSQPKNCILPLHNNGVKNWRIQTLYEVKQHTTIYTQTKQPPTKHYLKHSRKYQQKIIKHFIQ